MVYWKQRPFQNRVREIDGSHSDQVSEVHSLNIDKSVYATTIQIDQTMDRIDHLKAENASLKTEMLKMEERQRCEIKRVFESLSQRLDECV